VEEKLRGAGGVRQHLPPQPHGDAGNTKVGVVTASIAYQYAKEAFPEDTSFLKLG
jgi:hypothetical protein